ncbi:MAG: 4Fe-4S dicluster domain-containing protein, partial [Bacteroidales bacterium]|nr:4Fe-4S dicluster domain-containing protein [Bacteroidales bacterium]
MKICPQDKCFGCGACAAVCPQKCISLRGDALAVLHPCIDPDSCIDCGLCHKVCPAINPQELHPSLAGYAAKDAHSHIQSASGGIAALLARSHAHSFGTLWNKDFEAVVAEGEEAAFRGSKYVQSIISTE